MLDSNKEYRVKGYSNRWSVIDTYKGYALLENCTWGDETCYLLVKQDVPVKTKYKDDGSSYEVITEVIEETYDWIEDAVEQDL